MICLNSPEQLWVSSQSRPFIQYYTAPLPWFLAWELLFMFTDIKDSIHIKIQWDISHSSSTVTFKSWQFPMLFLPKMPSTSKRTKLLSFYFFLNPHCLLIRPKLFSQGNYPDLGFLLGKQFPTPIIVLSSVKFSLIFLSFPSLGYVFLSPLLNHKFLEDRSQIALWDWTRLL